jgi:hypothetical protein
MATTYLRGTNLQGYATPSGYRLQPAQSGLGGLSYLQQGAPTRTFQQTSYTPQIDTSSRPASEADLAAARNAQALAVQTVGKALPQNISIQKVRQGWMGNLNPELEGGIAEVNMDGQTVRVPNALLQQMLFTDAWNQGRSSAVGDFFGGRQGNPNPDVYRYSDTGASVGRINALMDANPQFTREGALNPYVENERKAIAANQRYQTLMGQMGQMTESRDASGRMSNQSSMDAYRSQAEEAKRERDQYASELNRAQARRKGAEEGNNLMRAMHSTFKDGIRRTYSNLPIEETFIR